MRLGPLRHRVTIQFEEQQSDGAGGYLPLLRDLDTVWASIQPISGNEALVARQLQDTVTHKVVMRYRAGVTAAMCLKFGTRMFNIREVRNLDERNHTLELRCEEGVAT